MFSSKTKAKHSGGMLKFIQNLDEWSLFRMKANGKSMFSVVILLLRHITSHIALR